MKADWWRRRNLGYRYTRSSMWVEDTAGEVTRRDVVIFYDGQHDLFGVLLIGETQLKGYSFAIQQSELTTTRTLGMPTDILPRGV